VSDRAPSAVPVLVAAAARRRLARSLNSARQRLEAAERREAAASRDRGRWQRVVYRLEADLRAHPSHLMQPWSDGGYGPEPGCRRCGCARSSNAAAVPCAPLTAPVLVDAHGMPYQEDVFGGYLVTRCCRARVRPVGMGKVACWFCGALLPDEWARLPVLDRDPPAGTSF
jgi:hypothetical protein